MSDLPHASASARVIGPEDLNEADLQGLLAPDPSEILFAPPDSTVLTLPTGILLDGELVREVEVRELTGADEETLARESRGKESFFPPHFLDLILRNAVIRVGDRRKPDQALLRSLLVGDRAYIGLAIRRLTYGDEWEVEEFVCRLCGKSFGVAIDLRPGNDIKMRILEDPRKQYVDVSTKRGNAKVRLVSGADELASIGDGTLTNPEQISIYIDRCTLSIEGQHPPAGFSKQLSLSDRRAIIDALGEAAPGPLMGEVSVPCSVCGQSADYVLSMADLFLR